MGWVALDKSEGSVKGIVALGGAVSTACVPERLRTKTPEISLNHSAVDIVPPTIDSA